MATEHLALARERLGQVLRDRWLLEKVIGVGGMAAVYQARHRNGARVAIKLLHPQVGQDPIVRERFLREAYLANSIDHHGVARVLDDDADENIGPFIVMELLEGASLLDRLDRGEKIDPMRALAIADQTLDVLAAAHRKGIVHRDLKPANLFVTDAPGGEPIVRVLDFGIARIIEENSARLTRTGVPLGTPAYMAPEQARGMGRHVDGRADIYALGATLFRTLAGRHVHVGQGADQIVKVATERAPSLAMITPSVPRDVCAIVDRALQFELDRRYGSAEEMQADVRAVRTGKRPKQPRLPTPALPLPRQAPSVDVDALASSLREEAHRVARKPDAFSAAPAKQPPPPSYDDFDDNLPTTVLPPKDAQRMVAQARDSASARALAASSTPSSPSQRRPSGGFPQITNVPVPTKTPHGGMPSANFHVADPENLPTLTQSGQPIVLPPAAQVTFEETQYKMEQGGAPASSPSRAAAPGGPRPFSATLADPSAGASARFALEAHGSSSAIAVKPSTPPPSVPWTAPSTSSLAPNASPGAPAPMRSAEFAPPPAPKPVPPELRATTRQSGGMSPVMLIFAAILGVIILVVLIAIVRTM